MGTYNLNASDLVSLLSQTVSSTIESDILNALNIPPGGVNGQLDNPPTGSSDVFPVSGTTPVELITIPDSTTTTTFSFLATTSTFIYAGNSDTTVESFNSGSSNNTLLGGTGAEKLEVFLGNNLLVAGSGLNTLVGGFGDDTLIGGGQTLLEAGGSPTGQTLEGGQVDWAHDTLIGSSGPDLLEVTQGANLLEGGSGLNTLMGGSGPDTLVGGGQSSLVAGSGNQLLLGGGLQLDSMGATAPSLASASGTLVGGSGSDTVSLGSAMGADSILGGTGPMTIDSTQSSANVSNSSTSVGGVHTLTFTNGQTVIVNDPNSNITIHFSDGGTTTV